MKIGIHKCIYSVAHNSGILSNAVTGGLYMKQGMSNSTKRNTMNGKQLEIRCQTWFVAKLMDSVMAH